MNSTKYVENEVQNRIYKAAIKVLKMKIAAEREKNPDESYIRIKDIEEVLIIANAAEVEIETVDLGKDERFFNA